MERKKVRVIDKIGEFRLSQHSYIICHVVRTDDYVCQINEAASTIPRSQNDLRENSFNTITPVHVLGLSFNRFERAVHF